MKLKKDLSNLTPEEKKLREKKINRMTTIIMIGIALIVLGGVLYYA